MRTPGPGPMTPAEKAVLAVLERHAAEPIEGLGADVPVKVLSALAGLRRREVQAAIARLVTTHHVPIGHSTNPRDPGNKLLAPHEVHDELDRLERRAVKIFSRRAALRRTSLARGIKRFAQLELWKGEEAA